MEKAILRR